MKKALTLGLVSLLFAANIWAADLHPLLMVVNITPHKQSEASGDEVYLHIAEYNSNGSSRSFTVPKLPLSWATKHIHQVDDIQIWGGSLSQGASSTLVVSIMERDAPPWDVDDLIGVVTINLKNVGGILKSEWTIPNNNKKPLKIRDNGHSAERLRFNANEGDYTFDFDLQPNALKPPILQKYQGGS